MKPPFGDAYLDIVISEFETAGFKCAHLGADPERCFEQEVHDLEERFYISLPEGHLRASFANGYAIDQVLPDDFIDKLVPGLVDDTLESAGPASQPIYISKLHDEVYHALGKYRLLPMEITDARQRTLSHVNNLEARHCVHYDEANESVTVLDKECIRNIRMDSIQ